MFGLGGSKSGGSGGSGSGSGSGGGVGSSLADNNYMYYKFIKTPSQMGMSPGSDLSNISTGVAGIISYIKLLVEGNSPASTTGQPLGNKYFYPTSQKCTDPDGNSQTLSLYVDNIPSGTLGIIPAGVGGNFSTFKGLIPGMLEDAFSLAKIDFFSAFSSMDPPKCQNVTLQTISVDNKTSQGTAYVSIDDIKNISPCNFVANNNTNTITGATCSESFIVNDETRSRTRRGRRYRNRELKKLYESDGDSNDSSNYRNKGQSIMMPDDIFLKIFILSFGALWIYVALKLMANMYKKR
jgi:hypothetical protein